MPTSNRAASGLVVVTLIVANLLLAAAGGMLRDQTLGAEPYRSIPGAGALNGALIYQNEALLERLFQRVRADRGVLYLGTSETINPGNLAAQLNHLQPDDLQFTVIAQPGMSLPHACVLFAKLAAAGIETCPLVLVINPVYLTESHDVIDEGWLGTTARTSNFLLFNHAGVREQMSAEARAMYDRLFAQRRLLMPLLWQEYAANLVYLRAHQATIDETTFEQLPQARYDFDGELPDYDPQRGVLKGYLPSDLLAKGRWEVVPAERNQSLVGLRSTVDVLSRQEAPVLLVVLPANRKFYAYYGLDMERFEARYAELRREIGRADGQGPVRVIDLFDQPELELGFKDRMHLDQYGYAQLARHVAQLPAYRDFVAAVRRYYDRSHVPPAADKLDTPGSPDR